MSEGSLCQEELPFQPVSRRHRAKKSFAPVRASLPQPDLKLDCTSALRRIYAAKDDLQSSDYYKSFLITFKESISLLNCDNVVEIYCLGLGHVGECMISRYQLALLLCLREQFDVQCFVHDPLFYTDECELLKTLQLNLVHDNQEGKRKLSDDGLTIVYFPHCPRQLTNNFLWKNWGPSLKNCMLICNSFTTIVESKPLNSAKDYFKYILDIYPFAKEYSLINCFKYNNIFNDTAIHVFPGETLDLITENFWKAPDSPVYEDESEFIAAKVIEKLRID